MSYYPLTLGVGRQAGATALSQQAAYVGEDLRQLKAKVFERDAHTCQACGFVSEKYHEVLHKDFNPKNFKLDNLLTTCIFCHQVFHLEKVVDMRSGVLIWLPEISQAALHHMVRALYVARVTQGPMADASKAALDTLMNRKDEAKRRLGSDDPSLLARVMGDFMEDGEYSHRQKKLEGIRLLPLDRRIIKEGDLEFNQFPQILAYWRSRKGPFGDLMPSTWPGLYEAATANVAALKTAG